MLIGPFKRNQHLTNIRSTRVERMLVKCWTQKQSRLEGFQTVYKGKVESMLIERLNRFELGSTRFQQISTFFTFSTMLDGLFKRTEHLIQQSVECVLKQMLTPFKWA